ncbi:hypothetical protein DXU06_35790 [Bradyrhizobium elkanii]
MMSVNAGSRREFDGLCQDWIARRGLAQMREEWGAWNSSPPSKLRDWLINVGRLPAVGPNPAAGFL